MHDYWDTSAPKFPTDVPTAELNTLSLRKLASGDAEESQRLIESCEAGFFLLDIQGSQDGDELLGDVVKMFELAKAVFDLEVEAKQKHCLKAGTFFGYKGTGYSKVDNKGTPDRCEFWGLAKDNILGVTEAEHLPDILEGARDTLRSFVEHSHAICMLMLSYLNTHLGLSPGTLATIHDLHRPSGDQARILKMPPQPEGDRRTSLLAHTDFGSISMVWNILGGLQVQRPDVPYNGDEGWEFVKPKPGCAIVNLGDAMRKFANGRVRSSLHRVTYAPGEQAICDRYSVVYFVRPVNGVDVKPLVPDGEESTVNGHTNGAGASASDAISDAAKLFSIGQIPVPT